MRLGPVGRARGQRAGESRSGLSNAVSSAGSAGGAPGGPGPGVRAGGVEHRSHGNRPCPLPLAQVVFPFTEVGSSARASGGQTLSWTRTSEMRVDCEASWPGGSGHRGGARGEGQEQRCSRRGRRHPVCRPPRQVRAGPGRRTGQRGGGWRAEPRGLEAGGGGSGEKEESAKKGRCGDGVGPSDRSWRRGRGASQGGGWSSFVTCRWVGVTRPGSH